MRDERKPGEAGPLGNSLDPTLAGRKSSGSTNQRGPMRHVRAEKNRRIAGQCQGTQIDVVPGPPSNSADRRIQSQSFRDDHGGIGRSSRSATGWEAGAGASGRAWVVDTIYLHTDHPWPPCAAERDLMTSQTGQQREWDRAVQSGDERSAATVQDGMLPQREHIG